MNPAEPDGDNPRDALATAYREHGGKCHCCLGDLYRPESAVPDITATGVTTVLCSRCSKLVSGIRTGEIDPADRKRTVKWPVGLRDLIAMYVRSSALTRPRPIERSGKEAA
jgi:hypothetical protein